MGLQWPKNSLHYRASTPHFRPIIIFSKHILMIPITITFHHSRSTINLKILVTLSALTTITGSSAISFYICILLLFSYIFSPSLSFRSLSLSCATSLVNSSPQMSLVKKFFSLFLFRERKGYQSEDVLPSISGLFLTL